MSFSFFYHVFYYLFFALISNDFSRYLLAAVEVLRNWPLSSVHWLVFVGCLLSYWYWLMKTLSLCIFASYKCVIVSPTRFRHKMIELYMQLSTTKFFNLFSPPRFSGRTPAPVCQGALQLRWQGTRRPQIQQGWHYHPASTSGWELVPRWDGWSPRLFPHQLCPSY